MGQKSSEGKSTVRETHREQMAGENLTRRKREDGSGAVLLNR